ncbi:MAG: hypothetical protein QXT30_08255 [Candidatus Bathyarchaeia archaeon]
MRLPAGVRRLLIKALKEEDPQRAVELFLAARLIYIAQAGAGDGGEMIEKIRERLNALDARLQSVYEALKALLDSEPAEERV